VGPVGVATVDEEVEVTPVALPEVLTDKAEDDDEEELTDVEDVEVTL
jgi:hypothetical protein